MSQAALAEAAGVTSNYISVLERGEKLPTLDTLVKLARAVRTSAGELLGDATAKDAWIDDVVAVAQTVPPSMRDAALAVLRALATAKGAGR